MLSSGCDEMPVTEQPPGGHLLYQDDAAFLSCSESTKDDNASEVTVEDPFLNVNLGSNNSLTLITPVEGWN